MKIITTPMCEEIVKLAGISEYIVNKFPDEEEGDLAIALSESNVEMDCVPIKINTPSQIFESIKKVSKINEKELSDEDVMAVSLTIYPVLTARGSIEPSKDRGIHVPGRLAE